MSNPDAKAPSAAASSETASLDFIRTIVTHDVGAGKHEGRVRTRFPPEPNGYLHIGHAKSICLNFGVAAEYAGLCNLRFDDSNPETEEMEYVESIQHDVRWLGFDWGARLFFASDYFEKLYECAVHLIERGKAYVCHLSEEEIRSYRGTVTEAGRPSPYRDRSDEENLELFERMKNGELEEGECVLRAKIDMAASNMKMRDPLLYRIRKATHYRRGTEWCIYPFYDFTHCLSDSFEDVTHSLCTLEFENNRELYDWVVRETEVPHQPRQIEFARLNLSYTVLSKRKLLRLVEEGLVDGWDDPRMPTISGLRRRGYTPESIRSFSQKVGIARTYNVIDVAQLEHAIRDDLNHKAPRVLAVLRPLKAVIENYPEGKSEELEAPYYPHDVPKEGSRTLPFSREILIERDDFMEDPPKGYFRLAPGREVRLRYAYLITCREVVKDDAGEVVELRCTYDPETRGGDAPDGRKVKGTIHWVSAEHSLGVEVRLYDRLFLHENPNEGDDFRAHLNPDSLEVLGGARIEPSVAATAPGTHFQLERQGYFVTDLKDSTTERLVLNRTVTLRDTWTKVTEKQEAAERGVSVQDRAAERAAKRAAEKARQRELSEAAADEEAPALSAEQEAEVKRLDEMGVADQDARLLVQIEELKAFFEEAAAGHENVRGVANFVLNEVRREAKDRAVSDLAFTGKEVGELVVLVDAGTITGKAAKDVFAEMVESGGSPREIVEAKGLKQLTAAADLEPFVDRVLEDEAENVALYRGGKTALMGHFVGRVMRETRGRANPQLVQELLRSRLS